jgi:preprotein translocase subunit SecG
MTIFIGFLTFILVLISAFLILLVLVQLPKKEAGVGMAFGAGMSEMLLGAGSGNVLTRITKYTVGTFLGLSLVLSVMVSHNARKTGAGVSEAIEEKARYPPPPPPPPPTAPAAAPGLQSLSDSPATPSLTTTTTVVTPTAPPATNTPADK